MTYKTIIERMDSFCSDIKLLNENRIGVSFLKDQLDTYFEFENEYDLNIALPYAKPATASDTKRTKEQHSACSQAINNLSKSTKEATSFEELLSILLMRAYFKGVRFGAADSHPKHFVNTRKHTLTITNRLKEPLEATAKNKLRDIAHPKFNIDDFSRFLRYAFDKPHSSVNISSELSPRGLWALLWQEKHMWPTAWTDHYSFVSKNLIAQLPISKDEDELISSHTQTYDFSIMAAIYFTYYGLNMSSLPKMDVIKNVMNYLQPCIDREKLLKLNSQSLPTRTSVL